MNFVLPIFASRWEHAFLTFLRTELASSPTRWRDALRLTLLCAVATTIVLAYHIPYGEFLVIFFIAVSQPDAWASFRKARLRGIGTLIGGGLSVVGIIACADKPWLFLVGQAFLFAVAMFLSRTTTIQYAVMLVMLTFVIATPASATDPEAGLDRVFWRILLTGLGAVIGTLAQLVLWPEHPERLLLRQLAERLSAAEAILTRVANVAMEENPPRTANAPVPTTIAGQLDLLASAEAGSRWLRQRHTEQIKLITDIEMILITALRLERHAGEAPIALQSDTTRTRIAEIRQQLSAVRRGFVDRSLPVLTVPDLTLSVAPDPDINRFLPVVSALSELDRILKKMPESMAFLLTAHAEWERDRHALDPIREPIAERSIFTPACRLSNVEAVRFALKSTLAATICYVLYQALNLPGISTCVVTALLCAQSSFGAGLQKSLLRLVGATLGGLAAVVAVVVVLPNVEGAAGFIVVASALFFAASWLTVGSSRISYVGLQVGLVLALVLLNQPNQAIDLSTAADRILGVLLGITVMGFIDLALWPNFAGSALRRKLAETLHALAQIPRHVARHAWEEANTAALAVHGQIAAALVLYNEWQLEFGRHAARNEIVRHQALVFIHELEEVFQALLVVRRYRRDLNATGLPPAWQPQMEALDEAIADQLETHAEAEAESQSAAPARRLLELIEQLRLTSATAESGSAIKPQLSESVLIYRELVEAVTRLTIHARSYERAEATEDLPGLAGRLALPTFKSPTPNS